MSARVSEDAVRSALTWARNYGEIESYSVVAPSGRRWKVVLAPTPVSGATDGITLLSGVVPGEMVLTSREALAFAYGCAVAGAKERRAEFAAREWGWGPPEGGVMNERRHVMWLCDRCGDHAEVEPGGLCEVCCEGTIQVVPMVPEALLRPIEDEVNRLRAVLTTAVGELAGWREKCSPVERDELVDDFVEAARAALAASSS